MIDRFENMIMRLYIMRMGKSKSQTWRVVYGAFTPCLEKMDEPFISESSSAGNCEWGKLSVKRIVWASERDVVLGIFKDLSSGISLKTSFDKWGVNTEGMTFDVSYNQKAIEEPWGMENILDRQLTYTRSVSMLEPEKLFEKDGKLAKDADKALRQVEEYLQKSTKLPFGERFDHVGNMDVIVEPERDLSGKPLVELQWVKGTPAVQHITVSKDLLKGCSEVTTNVRFADNGKVLGDRVQRKKVGKRDLKFDFVADDGTSCIETKVWLRRGVECYLVHHAMTCLVKCISVTMNAVSDTMNVTSDWLQKIRENLPSRKSTEMKEAETIAHSAKQHFDIGERPERRRIRKPLVKTNDEFFPKGWDEETDTQGRLSFLSWFKRKANDAKGVFLQDPYFEDVAMYFIASADTNCEYIVLTQTQLKTNPDGTPNTDAAKSGKDGERKKEIVNGIKANPLLFDPMKLVVKDVPISHNALHDRYLIFDYGDGRIEGYTLSNSLQGATNKQPLLITQIGDGAFEKVLKHIEATMGRDGIETIYDYRNKSQEDDEIDKCELRQIADKGFYDWIVTQKEAMLNGNVEHVLNDIRSWRTYDRMVTFGYFLADMHDEEAEKILEYAAAIVTKDAVWLSILKDFILKGHYSKYPVGYIKSPHRGWVHADCTRLLGMVHKDIVTPFNAHLIEYSSSEGHSFGVWGQMYAAKLLVKASPEGALDVLKQLRPTLLEIDTDRTVTPVFKVTHMLMAEMMETVVWQKGDRVMQLMLNDAEPWCRGIGALMLLYCAKFDPFNGPAYRSYMKDDDELVTLCYAAWGMKPEPANKGLFYGWVLDVFTRKADADYFEEKLSQVITGVHLPEDKADYIEKVAMPLVGAGIIDKDRLAGYLIEKLYDLCIEGQHTMMMRESLVMCLEKVGGDDSLLVDKAMATLDRLNKEINAMVGKNDDTIFHAAFPTIQSRLLLMLYARGGDAKIERMLSEVDKALDGYGLEKTKRMFEA